MAVFDDGYFIFNESVFTNNIAISGLVANMFNSARESIIMHSNISNNQFVDSATVISEINGDCTILCFSTDFNTFLSNHTAALQVIESSYALKSIISNFNVTQVDVYQQNQFVDAYLSTVVLHTVNITNLTFTQSVIKSSLSTLNGSDIIITNVDNPTSSLNSFISCSTDSSIYIDSLDYTQSQAPLMLLFNVTGLIDKLSIMSVDSTSSMIEIDDSYGLQLTSLTIDSVTSQTESIMLFKESIRVSMDNITISNTPQLFIKASQSVISRLHDLSMTN